MSSSTIDGPTETRGSPDILTTTKNYSSSALKCEKESIPVFAGECRADPIKVPIEKSLIRSASAEVTKIDDCSLCIITTYVYIMIVGCYG